MRLLLFFLLLSPASFLRAQDVEGFFSDISERIAARDYLRVSGTAGVRAAYNYFDDGGSGARPRNAPFNWGLNAALNFDFLGIKAPFNAAFSNRNSVYNLPSYSFYGISPTYRWITLHAGDRSLSFSPYSLSGVNFRGGGLELRPGNFYLGIMSGKLRRARIQDAGSIQDIETAYRRQGQGIKLGYDNQAGSSLTASLFNSVDKLNVLPVELDTALNISPERNMVLTVGGAHQLSKFLRFEAEWARSVLTRDERSPLLNNADGPVRLFGLFNPRTSTTASNAFKIKIGLSPEFGNVDFQYERIEPEYRTHGSLFFQNDLENFTAGLSAPLFDSKLTLSTNFGLQRNDLDNNNAANLNRLIGSLSLNYAVSDRVNTNLSLSNFTSTNRYKAIALSNLLVDSVVLAQTQQSIDVTTSIALGQDNSHALIFSGGYQRAALIRDEVVDPDQTSRFTMLLVSYAYQPKEAKGSFSGSLLAHRNANPDLGITTLGPNLGYNRKIFDEKGALSASAGYQFAFTSFDPALGVDNATDGVLQLSFGGNYKLNDKQTINLNTSLISAGGSEARPGYNDLQLTANYGFRF